MVAVLEVRSFSDFHRNASPEEKKKLLLDVAKKANQDQANFMTKESKATQSPEMEELTEIYHRYVGTENEVPEKLVSFISSHFIPKSEVEKIRNKMVSIMKDIHGGYIQCHAETLGSLNSLLNK